MEAFSHKQILLSKNHLLVNGPSTLAKQLVPSESAEGKVQKRNISSLGKEVLRKNGPVGRTGMSWKERLLTISD